MLTEEETREIEQIMESSLHWKDACVEALLAVQKHRGWVSDEVLAEVAGVLKMTPAELDGVVTFYNRIYRNPVGRHVILLCESASCWITGQAQLLERLQGRLGIDLGETTKDGAYTLLPMDCAGACDKGPTMMIDEQLYGDLTPDRIDEVLDSYDDGRN